MQRLIKPYIKYEDVEFEFREIFENGFFTQGKYVEALAEKLSEYTGAKHVFPVTSATTALSACLAVLDIGMGDEVVVSDFSFPATANVVEASGARPMFADVCLDTYNMDANELKRRITEKTKAVIYVCAFGNPDGIEEIYDICTKKGLPLIIDAACALGSKSNGIPVGAIGDLTCFSFHPRKLITSGEGGAITTNNEEYADILRVKLLHGSKTTEGKTEFVTYGYNYRLPELQSVMLIKQIEYLDDIIERRILQQERYREYLEPIGFRAQKHRESILHNMQSIVFSVADNTDRDGLIKTLRSREVETTIGTYCQSANKYYREKYNDIQKNALWLEQNTITFPCHEDVDVDRICESIRTKGLRNE